MVGKRKDWSEEVLSSNLSCWLSGVWKDSWKEKGISRRDSTNMLHACSVVSDSVTQWTVADPSGSSVRRIFQARILEWVAISSSRSSSSPRDQTHSTCVSCIGRQIIKHWATWEAHKTVWSNGMQKHLERWVNCRKGGMSGEQGMAGIWWQEVRLCLMLKRFYLVWCRK